MTHLQVVCFRVNVGKCHRRRLSRVGDDRDPRFNSSLEPGDSNHEKLVKVVRKDGKETDSLEEWNRVVFCEFEHATVKRKPGDFSVEKSLLRQAAIGGGSRYIPIVVELIVEGVIVNAHSSPSPLGANR